MTRRIDHFMPEFPAPILRATRPGVVAQEKEAPAARLTTP